MGGNVCNESENPEISPISSNGWAKLGYKVQSIVNTTPYLHYMLGSIREGKNLKRTWGKLILWWSQPWCLFIISEQLSVETNIQERQKPRKTYNRNDDVRPTTEAKVLDFKDKDSTTSMGGNMTDVLVESTYEQLVMAYRSANKVSIKHKCGYTIPNNIL